MKYRIVKKAHRNHSAKIFFDFEIQTFKKNFFGLFGEWVPLRYVENGFFGQKVVFLDEIIAMKFLENILDSIPKDEVITVVSNGTV